MPRPIPTTPADITPDWLTQSLRVSKTVTASRVSTANVTRIGEDEAFTWGGLYRVTPTYDPPDPTAPNSLVAKLSPADAETRKIMRRANAREVDFYRSQASHHDPSVPRCYHADFDPASGASVILLQDLGSHRSVPFIKGCGPGDAKRVVEALATLHAKWWNAPDLPLLSGASILNEFPFDHLWQLYPEKLHAMLPAIELPKSFLTLGDFIAQNAAPIFANLMETAPITRLHRDLQADNVMFPRLKGGTGTALLDWQFAGKGRGVYDVAYFLISSVDPAQRRNMERGLVAQYHAELLRHGVTGYSLAQCWTDYLQSVAGKLLMTVAATVLLDNSGTHKQAWRRADLTRLLAFCADHHIAEHIFSL